MKMKNNGTALNDPRSQTLFGNAIVFAVTQPPQAARPGFQTRFREWANGVGKTISFPNRVWERGEKLRLPGGATELQGQCHSQTELESPASPRGAGLRA